MIPIILFNLGLDSMGKSGAQKIEEMLMNSFIDSKKAMEIFKDAPEAVTNTVKIAEMCNVEINFGQVKGYR